MVDLSEMQRPKFDNKISLGSIFTLLSGIIAVGVIVGAVQADVKALAQRIDVTDRNIEAGDKRDQKTIETLDTLKGVVIELKTDQRAIRNDIERQNRQLDRIEQLLSSPRNNTPK